MTGRDEMKKVLLLAVMMAWTFSAGFLLAQERPLVGGFEQLPSGNSGQDDIGEGWGHRSMTYGMMNLMSGMATQAASILRTGKATPEMQERLAQILDHIADMLNYAPAYMMGTKTVDSGVIQEMHRMLEDLEKMRRQIKAM